MLQVKQKSLDFIDFLRERRKSIITSSKSIMLTVNQSTLDEYKSIRVSKNMSKSRIQHKFTAGGSRQDKESMRKTRKWQSILGHYMQSQEKIQKLKEKKSSQRYQFNPQDQRQEKTRANRSFMNMKAESNLQLKSSIHSDQKIKLANSQNGKSLSLPRQSASRQKFTLTNKGSLSPQKVLDLNSINPLSPRLVNFVQNYFRKKYKPKKYRIFALSGRQQQSFIKSLILKPY